MANLDPNDRYRLATSLVANPGWQHYFCPIIQRRIEELNRMWRDPTADRERKLPDQVIKGALIGLEWALGRPDADIREYEALVDRETNLGYHQFEPPTVEGLPFEDY